MSVRESIDPASSLWAWLAFDLWFHRTQRGLSLAQTAMIVHVNPGDRIELGGRPPSAARYIHEAA